MAKIAALRKPGKYVDPVKIEPEHYKVEFENDRVRALRIKLGPHEKSMMHDHMDGVAVFLTDQRALFTYRDGSTKELVAKAGETRWLDAFSHEPENLEDKPLELILIELKK